MTTSKVQAQIESIKKQLIKKYKPERVILFGSAVSGKMTSDSDLDFLIIKEDSRSFHERIADVYGLVEKDVAADFIVLTPREYQRSKNTNPFIREIESTGKVLYPC